MSKSFKSLSIQSISPVEPDPPVSFNPYADKEPMYRDLKRNNSGTVYLYLLVLSIFFSAVISWLYVTKPVIVTSEAETSTEMAPSLGESRTNSK